MWPFGKRLKDQNAVEKYRRWLRKWLLDDQMEKETAPERPLIPGGR